jgi:hypothetical protein
MKKLNNLQINPEKLLKNDELMALRGGVAQVACAINIDGFSHVYIGTFSGDCGAVEAAQSSYWGSPVGCWGGNCGGMA